MAATTEVIRMQFGQDDALLTPTAYFACIQELILKQIKKFDEKEITKSEALFYCYSAVISMLDFGVISH
jgi:hypothetical protein